MEFESMTPTEFVAGLADIMGVAHTEIATVDRALAKEGLRQVARGRARPDVTLREGVQIVCAWAGVKKLTDAAAEVGRLQRYRPREIPAEEYETITRKSKTFAGVFGEQERDLYGMNFIDVASWMAQQLGSDKYSEDKVRLSIEKGGAPELSCQWNRQTKTLDFQEFPMKLNLTQGPKAPKANVTLTASVCGPVLKWIFDVTEGA